MATAIKQNAQVYGVRLAAQCIQPYEDGQFVEVQCANPYEDSAHARKQIGAVFALRVATQRSEPYTSPIRKQLTSPLYLSVVRANRAGYSLLVPVKDQVAAPYEVKEHAQARQQNAAVYAARIAKKLWAGYGDLQRIMKSTAAPYSIRTTLATQVAMPYVLAIRVVGKTPLCLTWPSSTAPSGHMVPFTT